RGLGPDGSGLLPPEVVGQGRDAVLLGHLVARQLRGLRLGEDLLPLSGRVTHACLRMVLNMLKSRARLVLRTIADRMRQAITKSPCVVCGVRGLRRRRSPGTGQPLRGRSWARSEEHTSEL